MPLILIKELTTKKELTEVCEVSFVFIQKQPSLGAASHQRRGSLF